MFHCLRRRRIVHILPVQPFFEQQKMIYNVFMVASRKHGKLVYDKRDAIALALNMCLVVLEIKALIMRIQVHGRFGAEYYTQDSNLFMLIVAAMAVVFLVRKIIWHKEFPKWFSLLKYTVTLALLVTCLIVIFVLAPAIGWPFGFKLLLLMGPMYYTHLACPLLAVLSFCLLERHDLSDKRDPFLALIYTIIYAVVLLALNITHLVNGPYPFLMVYNQSVWESLMWIIGILGGAYLLAILLRFFRSRK